MILISLGGRQMSENILEIAEKLNNEVTRLNTERSKMEGMLESAKSNYEKAVKAYEMKYGVSIDEKSLQSEYNAVYARTKGAVLDLQEKVESIKRGDYKNNVTHVSFDLEPDVEPIRAEVKSDKTIPTSNDAVNDVTNEKSTDASNVLAGAEEISDASSPSLSFEGFSGFDVPSLDDAAPTSTENFEVKSDVVESSDVASESSVEGSSEAEAPKVKRGRPRKNAPIDASELKRAMEAMKEKPQTPKVVTPPDIGVVDDEDDEVSLDGMNFGQNPVSSDFNLGDLSGFGVEKTETPVNGSDNSSSDEKPAVEDAFGFGDFSGFGDLNLGSSDTESSKSDESSVSKEKKDEVVAEPSFGGFGDLDIGVDSSNEEDTKGIEKKTDEPITPDGWGSGFDFNFDNVGDILNGSNGSFGQ